MTDDLHSCGLQCERDACVAARQAAAAERARIIALLREMHDNVKPMHNYYAYAANLIEAMEEPCS
jgi:hypothetical protein